MAPKKKPAPTIDFLDDEPTTVPKEFKRHTMGKTLSVAARQTIMNVYSSLCASFPKESLGRIVKKTAEMTGVSAKTVWRVKKEHQQCGGKFKERVVKPGFNLGRKIRMSKYEKPVLDAITKKVVDYVAANEKPTCKKIYEFINADETLPHFQSMRTFKGLLEDLGFDSNYELQMINDPESGTSQPAPIKKVKQKPACPLPDNPYKVLSVSGKEFATSEVHYRSDNVLLCKRHQTVEKIYFTVDFEVLNPLPTSPHSYSLYRSDTKPEATNMYLLLKKVVPPFAACIPDLVKKDNLQELCDLANKNPSWSPAHLAAFMGWTKCFQNEHFAKTVNEVCSDTLVSPIHIAVQTQREDVIQTLIHLNAQLGVVDKKGNTVFHYAANTKKEIIQALCYWETPSLINKVNLDGHTPLQIACMANNAECITELLSSGADMTTARHAHQAMEFSVEPTMPEEKEDDPVCDDPMTLYTELSKSGGTALHLAESPQCLEALIDFGCHLDDKNHEGDTALHVFIVKNKIACVITLLSSGANPNMITADGNSCLHLAIKVGDPSIVQALLIFGADPNIKNAEGFSPRHLVSTGNFPNKELNLFILHTMAAERCVTMCHTCSRGCSINGNWDGVPPVKLSHIEVPRLFQGLLGLPSTSLMLANRKRDLTRGQCRVLCLDGGGVRALVIVNILAALEAVLGCSILKFFDVLSGTGTGGLVALLLSLGKSVEYCRGFLFRLKDKLFTGHRKYDQEILDKFLKKELGELVTLSEIKFGRVMITGIFGDCQPPELRIFRNFHSPNSILGLNLDMGFDSPGQYAWLVGRAACTTYLHKPEKYELGAWFASNPTLDVLTEIHEKNLALKATSHDDDCETIGGIISLGSGLLPTRLNPHRLMDKMAQLEGRGEERAHAMCSLLEVPYFRINPPLTEVVLPEETDCKVLVGMLWEANIYLNSKQAELLELAKIIKQL